MNKDWVNEVCFPEKGSHQPLSSAKPDFHKAVSVHCWIQTCSLDFLAHSKLCTVFLCLSITLCSLSSIKSKCFLFNTGEADVIQHLLCFQCLRSWKDKCVPEVCVRKHSLYIQATKECRCRGSISSKQTRQPMDCVRGPLDTRSSEQLNADSSQPDMHSVWALCMWDPCFDTFPYAKPWLYQFRHSQTQVNQPPSNHAAWFTR